MQRFVPIWRTCSLATISSRSTKYMTEDLVSHWLGDRSLHGIPSWRHAMASFFDAFPEAAYTLNDLFFAGDKGV